MLASLAGVRRALVVLALGGFVVALRAAERLAVSLMVRPCQPGTVARGPWGRGGPLRRHRQLIERRREAWRAGGSVGEEPGGGGGGGFGFFTPRRLTQMYGQLVRTTNDRRSWRTES